jgi:integrase
VAVLIRLVAATGMRRGAAYAMRWNDIETVTGTVRIRAKAGLASDSHLHSLRHFHADQIDSVLSGAQKQVRLGWSAVQMARHYTDGVPEEDRRAADHIERLLSATIGSGLGRVPGARCPTPRCQCQSDCGAGPVC